MPSVPLEIAADTVSSDVPALHCDEEKSVGMAKQRILVYTDDPRSGGVARYNHSLLLALAGAGYNCACAQTADKSPLIAEQSARGIAHFWIPYDTSANFVRTLSDTESARRILSAAKPDLVIFSDCCPYSNLAAREVARDLKIPFVVVVGFVAHYLAERLQPALPTLIRHYANAAEVIAVSQENLEQLHAHFGLGADRGRVIHYGRPAEFFGHRDTDTRNRLRAEQGIPEDAIVALTTARLATVKGHRYLLAAIEQLRTDPAFDKLRFVWIGGGELEGELVAAISKRGLTERIKLLGHCAQPAPWYDVADIFLLPSDHEGMPLAIMEAMAKGLPVAASAVSGIPEQLGPTGKLLPDPKLDREGMIQQLSATLSAWSQDAELREKIGREGQLRARELFREERMIEQTLTVIASALVHSRLSSG